MIARIFKILLVATVGLNLAIVTLDNAVFDYMSNYRFVQHVLSMDTLFSGDTNAWRALRAPAGQADSYWIYHVFYATIILVEAATAVLCFTGAAKLWLARKSPAATFNRAKKWAVCGLFLSMMQWFFAFETVGGAWFQMWQSSSWNGLGSASRMFIYVAVIFLILNADDKELTAD